MKLELDPHNVGDGSAPMLANLLFNNFYKPTQAFRLVLLVHIRDFKFLSEEKI
jgi:hypothetical protein